MKIYFDPYYDNINTATFRIGVLRESLDRELIAKNPRNADIRILPPFQMSRSIFKTLKHRKDSYIVDEWLGTIIENTIEKGHLVPSKKFFEKFRAVYFKNSRKIIVISKTHADYLIEKIPASEGKFDVFNWIVDTRLYMPPENKEECKLKIGASEDDLVCLYFGGGYPFHGVEHIIDAVPLVQEKNKKIRFYFIGPKLWKYQTAKLKKQVSIISTVLPKMELIPYLKGSDIFLSSFGSEKTMARVHPRSSIYLAMGTGLVPLASNLPGPKTIIKDKKNGLLVKPANSVDIAEKILYLSENRSKLEKMGKNARKTIVEDHSPEYVRKIYKPKFLKLIEEISSEIHTIM